jgi:poly(A) polymerase
MTSAEASHAIIAQLRDSGHEALLAGGCVRDRLLGLIPKDHDVATSATPAEVVRLFRRTKQVGAQFGVVLVALGGCEIEVATFRTDGPYRDGRRPEQVTFSSAEADAQRRDFTINGMFYDPVTERVVDYVGGQQDLAARIVRCIGEPERRFAEDHLRMLRAVRFAARLGFSIDAGTFAAMRDLAPRLADISAERIRMELELILTAAGRARGWELMVASGLSAHLAAGAAWSEAQARRVGAALAAVDEPVSVPLAFAVLLEGRPRAEVLNVLRALRCSNDCMTAVAGLVAAAPRLLDGAGVELADLKQLLAVHLFAEAVRLARATAAADARPTAALDLLVAQAAQIPADAAAPPPFVTGDDLAAMGVPPGRIYSVVLDAVYRAQRNETLASREPALQLARELLARAGQKTS